MTIITMSREAQQKNGSDWETVETEKKPITETHYKNIIEAKSFFESLGGTELHEKASTCDGVKVVKNISTDPSGQLRTVYNFSFESEYFEDDLSREDVDAAANFYDRMTKKFASLS